MARNVLVVLGAMFAVWASVTDARALRQSTDLSRGWRFQYGVEAAAPQAPDFDDRGWQIVRVPHTWNRLGEYRRERSHATNDMQGVGWYRLTFRTPRLRPGQRHYLEFDGVASIAQSGPMANASNLALTDLCGKRVVK